MDVECHCVAGSTSSQNSAALPLELYCDLQHRQGYRTIQAKQRDYHLGRLICQRYESILCPRSDRTRLAHCNGLVVMVCSVSRMNGVRVQNAEGRDSETPGK
jgi:hypothetical protein